MIQHWGWRSATAPVFIACLLVMLLAILLLRNRPADVGLIAFGDNPAAPQAQAARLDLTWKTPFAMFAEASRNRTFWILFGTFFICGLSTNGLIQTHFITLCGDFGLGPVPAASVLAMMGAFDLVGTIMSGWLSDRYDNRKLLFWYYLLRGLSLIWLPHSEFSIYGLSIFAMFYGLDWIATVPPTVRLAGNAFGPVKAGMAFGWIFAAHQLGAATAAYGAGFARTMLLTYSPAIYAAGGACVVAAIAVMMIRKPSSTAGSAAKLPVTAARTGLPA
jgi:predicted MFS family arabinose efflux permease